MELSLPPLLRFRLAIDGNVVSQVHIPRSVERFQLMSWSSGRAKGYEGKSEDGLPFLLLTNGAKLPNGSNHRILRKRGLELDLTASSFDLSELSWEQHPGEQSATFRDAHECAADARMSWWQALRYTREDSRTGTPGLRPPQLGALYAAQSHFTVYDSPATIVMPTGTGKTETMLSILVAEQCERLLIVVPTDALRTQIAEKFLTLGVLKDFGVVTQSAQLPVVGVLKHGFSNEKELSRFVTMCNVVVATMPLVSGWPPRIQSTLASHFSHLFVDEAHHLGAPKWEQFRSSFLSARILQFTATPYRNDGKPIGGDLIFDYPLGRAQADGYFKPISFKAVVEFDPRRRDKAIADAAIDQLKADYDKGHILMARVSSIKRAEEVFKIYQEYTDFTAVQIHSGIKSEQERKTIRRQILNREARIVVCVDMLGEGFDLPELKIAAFHDVRQSLPITLQLAGRFTRSRPDLGNATFIANIADASVKEELQKLYQHDGDWNQLLPLFSDRSIAAEFDLWEFVGGFKNFPKQLSLHNVRPAMSVVAYRTRCKEWTPDQFAKGISGYGSLDRVYSDVNASEDTLVILTARRIPVEWARISDIYSWDWQLYILIWDRHQNILFVHNSSNSGFFKNLAKSVCGENVTKIGGPEVFRCLATVSRLRLNNVGLLEQLGRFIRFTMRAGSDVESGLTEAQKQRAIKSNVFGIGYEDGSRTSIGCSYKGRIWSHQTTNLREIKRWCQGVGRKLVDASLDPDQVLEGTLRPETVSVRPSVMPIGVDWPDLIVRDMSRPWVFRINEEEAFLHECDLTLHDPSEDTSLRLELASETHRALIELQLFDSEGTPDYRFIPIQGKSTVQRGNKSWPLEDFFNEYPPTMWFADGSSLRGQELVRLRKSPDPFPKDRIEVWDWSGINIRKESQGIERDKTSIQCRVMTELRKRPFSVLFDDDDSGEAADVVGVIEQDTALEIEFYHCKYSKRSNTGARVEDLYEVCGQAQRSVRWMEDATNLFTHLLRREPREKLGVTRTRFEVGTAEDLWRLREKSRRVKVSLKVYVVQPGVSKATVSKSQLELLGVTENYLMETFMVPFGAIVSE